jgi:hypothetical protein
MTTEFVAAEVLHPWAIYLRASEEARHRGDRQTGKDRILLALLEEPPIESMLGVSLHPARKALEALDQEALDTLGMGYGIDASELPMRAVPERPRFQGRGAKRSLPHDASGQESPSGRGQAQSPEDPGHDPAGAGPDTHAPTPRSCGGAAAGRSRRERVGASAPIGRGHGYA